MKLSILSHQRKNNFSVEFNDNSISERSSWNDQWHLPCLIDVYDHKIWKMILPWGPWTRNNFYYGEYLLIFRDYCHLMMTVAYFQHLNLMMTVAYFQYWNFPNTYMKTVECVFFECLSNLYILSNLPYGFSIFCYFSCVIGILIPHLSLKK